MKKLFLHGGSSEISKYLIKYFYNSFDEIHVFVRNYDKAKKNLDLYKNKITFYTNSLNNISNTLKDIEKLPSDLTSVIWLSGDTGNSQIEFNDFELCKNTMEVNFNNVILSLNLIIQKKILFQSDSFLCVFTSVAGLRGRNFNTFYGASKAGLISYLSSLRQRLNKKMLVSTIIPGYMRTNQHTADKSSFITTTPEKSAKIVFKGIKNKKNIIFIDFKWKIIMKLILLIPEKIFKKLKF